MIEQINGYVCRNCTDVALAKRNIDPAHPHDPPGGVDNRQNPASPNRDVAVTFGGNLSASATNAPAAQDSTTANNVSPAGGQPAMTNQSASQPTARVLDISA